MAHRVSRSAREPSMNPPQPGTRWQAGTCRNSTEQFQQSFRCLLLPPVMQVPEQNFHDSCRPLLPMSAFQHHVGTSARWNLGQCQPSCKELGTCRVQLSGFHHFIRHTGWCEEWVESEPMTRDTQGMFLNHTGIK